VATLIVTAILAVGGYAMTNLYIAMALLIGTPSVVLIVRFGRDLLFSPSLIHADSLQEISRLHEEVRLLDAKANPTVSPEDAQKREMALKIMERASFTPKHKEILRRILDYGGTVNYMFLDLECGFDSNDVRHVVTHREAKVIVKWQGDDVTIPEYWRDALGYVLND
jgi:hypothetical protein